MNGKILKIIEDINSEIQRTQSLLIKTAKMGEGDSGELKQKVSSLEELLQNTTRENIKLKEQKKEVQERVAKLKSTFEILK